jgi:NAD+ kinase
MAFVAFVVHPERPDAAVLAERAETWLRDHGHRAERVDADLVTPTPGDDPPAVPRALRREDALAGADLAVSLGGDGTMLRTVELATGAEVPVLGVNLGRLGYLTDVEPAGLERALERFLAGDYSVEERMTLEVSVEPGEGPDDGADHRAPASGIAGQRARASTFLALNEAVVEKTVPGHTIRLRASIGGRPFVTYAADGLLVCTPTGSTAYNLSARGPIVSPRLRALVVTPISPHMLFDRPLVLEPDEWLRLELLTPRPAVAVVDGLSAGELEPGDAVVCRASKVFARLVTFGDRDFHAVLKARFGLADR